MAYAGTTLEVAHHRSNHRPARAKFSNQGQARLPTNKTQKGIRKNQRLRRLRATSKPRAASGAAARAGTVAHIKL